MTDAVIIAGLGFGDEGKGTTVAHLAEKGGSATVVVRYNGGAQAAHTVVLPDGRWHQFSQFGSGTFSGARTYLSRFVLVNPLRMNDEADAISELMRWSDPYQSMAVDRECWLTTPYHIALNRSAETRRAERHEQHGSCGMGIGSTMSYGQLRPFDVPTVGDIGSSRLNSKLSALRHFVEAITDPGNDILAAWPVERLVTEYEQWALRVSIQDRGFLRHERLRRGSHVIFEGAQGALLDEWHGFHPHTTWSTTLPDNALRLCAEAGFEPAVLGVTRSYHTRHGRGPFVTNEPALVPFLPEPHNGTGHWMGPFRVGHLDTVMLRYAAKRFAQLDGLVVTFVDDLPGAHIKVCDRYAYRTKDITDEIIDWGSYALDLEGQQTLTGWLSDADPVYRDDVVHSGIDRAHAISDALDQPIELLSFGPTSADKVPLKIAQTLMR